MSFGFNRSKDEDEDDVEYPDSDNITTAKEDASVISDDKSWNDEGFNQKRSIHVKNGTDFFTVDFYGTDTMDTLMKKIADMGIPVDDQQWQVTGFNMFK